MLKTQIQNYITIKSDVLGRTYNMGQWTTQNNTVNVDALPNGTYFLVLKSEKGGVAVASFLIRN